MGRAAAAKGRQPLWQKEIASSGDKKTKMRSRDGQNELGVAPNAINLSLFPLVFQ
jgi:hypothetical protein